VGMGAVLSARLGSDCRLVALPEPSLDDGEDEEQDAGDGAESAAERLSFGQWLRSPGVSHQLSESLYLKVYTGTKSLIALFGQFAVNFSSVTCRLAQRLITEPSFRVLCRWHVHAVATVSRFWHSQHLNVIGNSAVADLSKYALQCRGVAAAAAEKCQSTFPHVYADEAQIYMAQHGG
jgi:hypothetical protein